MTRPPLEREVFNVDQDPFEMQNIVNEVPQELVEALSAKIQRMIQCRGADCRDEHSTGLEKFWSHSTCGSLGEA
jgi:hypothetical protein